MRKEARKTAVFVVLLFLLVASCFANLQTITSPSDALQPGWNLISVPGIPYSCDPRNVFSGTNIEQALCRWDSPSQSLVTYTALASSAFGGACLNDGYLVYSDSDRSISFKGITDNNTTDVWISLPKAGWTLIGNPHQFETLWSDVRVTDGKETVSLAEARQRGWLSSKLYGQPTADNPIMGLPDDNAPDTYLRPWRAYFIKSSRDRLALIVPTASTIPPDPVGGTIYAAKASKDWTQVVLSKNIVTFADANSFYIEQDLRGCGLKVQKTGHGMMPGMRVDVTGLMQTGTDGERYIAASSVKRSAGTASAPFLNAALTPLGMNVRSLYGADWYYAGSTGVGQRGVKGGLALNTAGLLVRVWGSFQYVNSTTFLVTDGTASVRCVIPSRCTVTLNPAWKFIEVTGISSMTKSANQYFPIIKVREVQVVTNDPPRTVNLDSVNLWIWQAGDRNQMLWRLATGGSVTVPEMIAQGAPLSAGLIRSINPGAKVYYTYDLYVKAEWDSDWNGDHKMTYRQNPITYSQIQSNNWWLRDCSGHIVNAEKGMWLLDPGKYGYKEAYLQGLVARLAGKGVDGVVFDFAHPNAISRYLAGQGLTPPSVYPNDDAWFTKAWKPFFSYVMDGLHKQGYRVIVNCGGMPDPQAYGAVLVQGTDWQRSYIDGTIYETYGVGWQGQWLSGATAEARMNSLSKDQLEVLTCDGLTGADPEYSRKFPVILAMYYLAIPSSQDNHSYHHYKTPELFWEPLYDFYIGEPAANRERPYPNDADRRYFWVREFTKGIVLLNYNEASEVEYSLDKSYHDIQGNDYSGSIVIAPHSALILASD